jgi:hypothetical protein
VLVLAYDPSSKADITYPGRDAGEIHLALPHHGKLRIAIPVFVMHVVDEVSNLPIAFYISGLCLVMGMRSLIIYSPFGGDLD